MTGRGLRAALERAAHRALVVTIAAPMTGAALALPGGWWVMLLLGSAHHELHPAVPAVGYWPSVFMAGVAVATFATVAPASPRPSGGTP